MILIDSSVWIDYLNPRTSVVDQKIEALIKPSNRAVITGIIFQEVLQGIRNERSYQLTQKLMQRLPFLTPHVETHFKAAEIFKLLSSKGKILSTIDILIAALSIQYKALLFTLDNDFQFIRQHTDLKFFEI